MMYVSSTYLFAISNDLFIHLDIHLDCSIDLYFLKTKKIIQNMGY